jgi:hypothetical protein
MTPQADVRVSPAPARPDPGRRLLRRVCTNNPFYVLSAGLFLAGLWASFGAQSEAVQTWALMGGLAGYTLLLAVTACLLVRFGNVWDDVRTVLLLIVLMFLATSVTFDEVLVLDPARGLACYLGGLLFAVAVSEGLLRGIRLRLPGWFRLPYYLILALFFLYPLALSPLVNRPHGEALLWGLFGFSTAAGLVFLTLLPAVRRGPESVRDNGSPWGWPLYPWVLFGVLGFAVPGRAFLLCWSMHLLGGVDHDRLIFGPYFLVPFGLAVAALLLERGLVTGTRGVLGWALALPAGLVALALVGHRDDSVYREFLGVFTARLGGDPLWVTLLAVAGFYAYAWLRRAPLAAEMLTGALVALAFVGPDTLDSGELVGPEPAPLLAAGVLQLGLGLWRGDSRRCLVGAGTLVVVAALAFPGGSEVSPLRALIAFHGLLAAVLLVGAAFDDGLGRRLRLAGAALALAACLGVLFGPMDAGVPAWALLAYPVGMAVLMAGYGLWLRFPLALAVSALVLSLWLSAAGWRGYSSLRRVVAGLDQIALSLVLLALAILISLGKSGVLARWARGRTGSGPAGGVDPPPGDGIWRAGDRVLPDAVRPAPGLLREDG